MAVEYVSFESRIETYRTAKATFTILPIPDAALAVLEAQGAVRVEGEINDHPVNFRISRSPGQPGAFVWAGKTTLDAAGIAPGDTVQVRLRAADTEAVEVPEDLIKALRVAEKTEIWDALTAGKRRGMLYQVKTAKRAATRAKRIAKLVDEL